MTILSEDMLSLADAAKSIPGGRIHVSTIYRWVLKGCKGIRLETVMRGGVRMTSTEAIERFFAATTAAADGTTPAVQTRKQRQRAIEQAEKELAAIGI